MSANFSAKCNKKILRMDSHFIVSVALIIQAMLVVGCVSFVEKGMLPEVVARHPPDIQLGSELILLEKPPILASSLIDKEGAVHIFVVDYASRLNHIKVIGDKIITQDFLGIIETEQLKSLDVVEHPPGKLRVLAGNKQYFQVEPDLEWQEIKGNRCARFLPVEDKLFCAFVINGEEIELPERTDYTYGWFFLVPIVYWSHVSSSKLVLAEESPDGWITRAVVDPDTPMDAHRNFMVETDSLGNIHLLYSASRGGGVFIAFAYGYGGGGHSWTPNSKLHYARLTFDQLLSHSSDAQNQTLSNPPTPIKWMTLKGFSLEQNPFRSYMDYDPTASIVLNPLNSRFAVNKTTGNVDGLIWASQCPIADPGLKGPEWLYNPFFNKSPSVVEVSIHKREWALHFDIVATEDFPASGIRWGVDNLSVKLDAKGKYHLLLQSIRKFRKSMNYLVKTAVDWSAPLTLGSAGGNIYRGTDVVSLAVDDSGVAFAAWVNGESKFVGRWIKPRSNNTQ